MKKTFRLYFKYIQGTELEKHWTLKELCKELEAMGYIKVKGKEYEALKPLPKRSQIYDTLLEKGRKDKLSDSILGSAFYCGVAILVDYYLTK